MVSAPDTAKYIPVTLGAYVLYLPASQPLSLQSSGPTSTTTLAHSWSESQTQSYGAINDGVHGYNTLSVREHW